MKEDDRTHSIGTVANLVGVPKYKLRHWCDRYLPEIRKIRVGEFTVQRRFTERDVELITRIKAYRKKGFTLDAAISQARQDLDGGKE